MHLLLYPPKRWFSQIPDIVTSITLLQQKQKKWWQRWTQKEHW